MAQRKFHPSPFYIWRSCKPCVHLCTNTLRHAWSQRRILRSTWEHYQTYPIIWTYFPSSAKVVTDQENVPNVLGHHGIGKLNENGQSLLKFCCYKLCVTNAYFQNSAFWKYSRSNHWYQLNLVITRHNSLNNICNTWAYHSADSRQWPLFDRPRK